ncbi:Decarbamoylnovobiocin carbamoyltransferase [Fundidesulfovibrio magnetotacticus]|uniref:Decarbamoylnovobiocin carbamoyltransferase n=1 Tax=Fundidesulfovibrio magnetotacticus TaxID=2730080 RepID=A0A6V8LR22_9BACT|nr:carbamoyltransferase C-terminal domain-containing protein [Fundidesulfovibrio magnetotacticus]GFK94164.1 Decarbamoylnovobiocin carbamoyltransferase [Fundidesulfovibrio magnetotacticus]
MNILAIQIGIGASVCLLKDGKIVLAVEEERLCRQKGFMGFPAQALAYLKTRHPRELDSLALWGIPGRDDVLHSKAEFQTRYDARLEPARKPSLAQSCKGLACRALPDEVKALIKPSLKKPSVASMVREALEGFELPEKSLRRPGHHLCHAAAAYYGLGRDHERPYLVLTLDGGGDGLCATVSIGRRGRLETVAATPTGHSVGNLYSNITHLLGFTPHEHEYKLMGMAPYVPERHTARVRDILAGYVGLDPANPMLFKRLIPESTTICNKRLARDLRRQRFDNVAGGLQRFTEELVTDWVKACMERTGIRDLLCSGGVFMNVKLNQRLSRLPEVRSIDVFPSCGDETNALGCAFLLHNEASGGGFPEFRAFTLGPAPSFDLEEAKARHAGDCTFEKLEDPHQTAAELIASGRILARVAGPMEFGARALGNRSILCDPSRLEMVERVNFLIKQRDFWMPFAPAILREDAERYLVTPPTLPPELSPYMMFTFDTTEAREEMIACLQRADRTARAQVVNREYNPGFHELLTRYKALTGRGAVMNTSYNIHGHPIAMGSMDALEILVNSSLDHVLIEDVLVGKRKA